MNVPEDLTCAMPTPSVLTPRDPTNVLVDKDILLMDTIANVSFIFLF